MVCAGTLSSRDSLPIIPGNSAEVHKKTAVSIVSARSPMMFQKRAHIASETERRNLSAAEIRAESRILDISYASICITFAMVAGTARVQFQSELRSIFRVGDGVNTDCDRGKGARFRLMIQVTEAWRPASVSVDCMNRRLDWENIGEPEAV